MHRAFMHRAILNAASTVISALALAACGRIGYDARPFACADSGMQCPADAIVVIFEGHAYAHLPATRTYDDARAACRAMGADLAHVGSAAEHDFLWALAMPEVTWIGGSDRDTSDEWIWVDDGTLFWEGPAGTDQVTAVYANWGEGEPNDTNGIESCLTLWPPHGGRWADESCELRYYAALCEEAR